MEIADKGTKVLHVEEVADLIELWRSEVAQEPTRTLKRADLANLLERWEGAGLDPMQLAYVLLGSEWLFRARLATSEDIRRELTRMRASLCNPRRGPLEADQAAVMIDALWPALVRELSQRRFLVSLGQWAVRGPLTRWETWEAAKLDDPQFALTPQVKRKQGGRIPTLEPIVAGVVAGAIASAKTSADGAEALGVAAAELLLGRAVPTGEFRRWRGRLDRAHSRDEAGDPSASESPSLGASFALRFRLGFTNRPGRMEWGELMRQAREEPRRCFDLIANSEAVSTIYSMSWAVPPARPIS